MDDSLYATTPVEVAPLPEEHEVRVATRSVARENRRAAALSPQDARNILAARISELLQGGRAAILTPEHRARAIRISRLLGVRDFDAHLVIALVQDRARRGELTAAGATQTAANSSFGFRPHQASVGPPTRLRLPRSPDASWSIVALQATAAVLLACAMLLGLLTWLR